MIIALEGLDGSGKRTQSLLLKKNLERAGGSVEILSFPCYENPTFGKKIAAYLNGEFGDLNAVTPYLPALLFAGDRFESRRAIEGALRNNEHVVFDRYTASNMAYQGAHLKGPARKEFILWVARLENEIYDLPLPHLNIYLSTAAEVSMRMVSKKGERDYTDRVMDMHEENENFQDECAIVYEDLATGNLPSPWARIECLGEGGKMKPESLIADAVWEAVRGVLRGGEIRGGRG